MKIQKFKKRIGLIGFGCVGQGLYDIVAANPHLGLEIGRICVKDKDKPRTLPAAAFTFDVQEVLQDTSLDILAELISEPDEALKIIRAALQQGKTIVSANKKVIAENLPEFISLQQRYGGVLLYEASVCGSIPILRTLEAYYGSEPLLEVRGVLNGSSNYILSKLHQEKVGYAAALEQAQALGFAEADPALDVEGIDALHKLCIVAAHAYGLLVHPSQVLHFGISHITAEAIDLADAVGARIKLVGTIRSDNAGNVSLQVIPTLVVAEDALYDVEAEFNGVEVNAQFAGQQFLKGRGAGSHPTGSAVWADISAAVRGYRYTYPKLCVTNASVVQPEEPITVLLHAPQSLTALLGSLQPIAVHKTEVSNQVIVKVQQEKLLEHQELLKEQGVFVAHLPESMPLAPVLEKFTAVTALLV
ncbi:homoserine dehydrogenase [Pontibacter sp. JH31]|uniref:Homoserine dehydrogenase n=1 Tax=Pontibacter aquaedesilientis TaxID=2766980 RepID=A0ABR7XFV9_9BACT|nr:homoserine dehydrogenase [Pontibacter aquaedesilientis]MBD1397184.1 homoserine dehydrogenase [Pontibacter aquaedesilientis]